MTQFRGRIMRYGVIAPPASDREARAAHCLSEGLLRLHRARKLSFQVDLALGPFLQGITAPSAPRPKEIDFSTPLFAAAHLGADIRVAQYALYRAALSHKLRHAPQSQAASALRYLRNAREVLQNALTQSIEAFHFFDDVLWDYNRDQLIDNGPASSPFRLGDLWEDSHRLSHSLGDLRGGLFACPIQFKDGVWWRECPIHLMHVRYGNSMGFTSKEVCSICGLGEDDCDHKFGSDYLGARRVSVDGTCNVCRQESCGHIEGDIYEITARKVMTDIRMHEVSMVPRPRDPLARFMGFAISAAEFQQVKGIEPHPRQLIRCLLCIGPCTGFDVTPGRAR